MNAVDTNGTQTQNVPTPEAPIRNAQANVQNDQAQPEAQPLPSGVLLTPQEYESFKATQAELAEMKANQVREQEEAEARRATVKAMSKAVVKAPFKLLGLALNAVGFAAGEAGKAVMTGVKKA